MGVIPTMTYFEQALSAPKFHFKRLGQMEPLRIKGAIVIRRNSYAIESEIVWNDRHYLLSLPFSRDKIRHIEELEYQSAERRGGPLIHNQILYNELTLRSSVGLTEEFDVVLQEVPRGMKLEEALQHYRTEEVRMAVERMKRDLDAIGFLHRNLRHTNIIICDNGIAAPLRYWHAEWRECADNNISALLEVMNQHHQSQFESHKYPLPLGNGGEYPPPPIRHRDIIRLRRGNHYGFIDSDGGQITPFVYTWASEMEEGRAVVARNNKMGAIDLYGKKVIPVIYKSVEFDVTTGTFTATLNNRHYLLDYDGRIIRRTTPEVEAEAQPAFERVLEVSNVK